MSFTVTIKENCKSTKQHQEWVRVADTGNPIGGGPVYAYAPPKEIVVSVERTLMEQTVDDLDLQAVIRAVNGMPEPAPAPVRRHRRTKEAQDA